MVRGKFRARAALLALFHEFSITYEVGIHNMRWQMGCRCES
jgi:hypothetical protein